MKEIKKLNFKRPVVMLKILDNSTLVVVDNQTTVRFLNRDTLKVTGGFKAGMIHERFKQNVVTFSSDGTKFASLSSDCREARLFNTQTKKAIAKMTRHQGEVACVEIDSKDRYMFTGGEDGKTFVVDLKTGKLAFTLPHHADTINEIAFSPNGNWCVTVSYDRKVGVFNIATMTPKHKLKLHAAPVMKAKFIDASRFISIDKNSTAIVWNTYSGEAISRLQGIHDDVREMLITKDGLFLFLGTQLGHVLVYELENYTLLARSYIKLSTPISSLEFDSISNFLIVGSEDGNIIFYDIYEGRKHLKILLKQTRYDKAYKETENNPLLVYTKEFKFIYNMWEKTYEKAKYFLQRGERKKAISLFENFKNIPSKKTLINRLLQEYKDFDKFIELVKGGKFALAYSMARITPIYQESSIFKSLEKQWQKTFIQAQKMVMQPSGLERAKDILVPYRGIPEKTNHIQELLKEGKVYVTFKKVISEKNFRMAFKLIDQFEFLKEFPEYTAMISYADKLYIYAQKYILDDNTAAALKTLKMLSEFNDFEKEANQLRDDIENRLKFERAMRADDILLAYSLLDNSDDLQETEDGKKLQKAWNDDLEKANSYAASGDIDSIEEVLKPYMQIKTKYMAIGSVVAWCYVTQLEKAVKEKTDLTIIEDGIKKYILTFGLRDEIESFYHICQKFYEELEIDLEMLPKGSLKQWRPSMIEKSILLLN
jgi:WD40 repeat protein